MKKLFLHQCASLVCHLTPKIESGSNPSSSLSGIEILFWTLFGYGLDLVNKLHTSHPASSFLWPTIFLIEQINLTSITNA